MGEQYGFVEIFVGIVGVCVVGNIGQGFELIEMFIGKGQWYQGWVCFGDVQVELLCNVIGKVGCVYFGDRFVVCGDYQ